jgi:hypothetical protein
MRRVGACAWWREKRPWEISDQACQHSKIWIEIRGKRELIEQWEIRKN